MARHQPDLVMCRKTTGIVTGKLCEGCAGRCPICDSYVRQHEPARICDECDYGSSSGRCIICKRAGTEDAYYCYECCQQEKDRDGCPAVINMSKQRASTYYSQKKYGFKDRTS